MDLDELKSKYKSAPVAARIGIMAIIGLAPAGYIYMEEYEALDAKLVAAQQELESNRRLFEEASKKKGDLPRLQEQLNFTEEQLAKAKRKLPDSYRIEDVLQKVATISKEVGVKLLGFRPEREECVTVGPIKYMTLPIATELEGRFNQLAAFMDRVVHLETSVFIGTIDMKLAAKSDARDQDESTAASGATSGGGGTGPNAKFEQQKRARQNVRIASSLELKIFRAANDGDAVGCSERAGGVPGAEARLPADPATQAPPPV